MVIIVEAAKMKNFAASFCCNDLLVIEIYIKQALVVEIRPYNGVDHHKHAVHDKTINGEHDGI